MDSFKQISESGDWEVDRKEIETYDVIGTGSFGNVLQARWRGTPVAVKQLKSFIIDISELRTDFVALTKLHHPNILQILGACTEKEPIIIMTELMTCSLEGYNHTNTTFTQATSWCLDIVRGLAYLHNRTPKCVIHRDLKPSNLLLTQSKRVKICDFGLSCFQLCSQEPYNMTSNTGTYRYMAPEIIKCEKYNSSVDIYSFSIIAYTLYEELPYITLDTKQLMNIVLQGGRPTFGVLDNIGFKLKLKRMITRCWDDDPFKRPLALDIINEFEHVNKFVTDVQECKKSRFCLF